MFVDNLLSLLNEINGQAPFLEKLLQCSLLCYYLLPLLAFVFVLAFIMKDFKGK